MSKATKSLRSKAFDSDTAAEIQDRAKEYLDRLESDLNKRRLELGVSDELRDVPGLTSAMLVAVGEDGVKTMDDFAGYAVDDLVGWRERKDGETVTHSGILTPFEVSRADAEQMVLAARLKAGWITEDQLEEAANELASSDDEEQADA